MEERAAYRVEMTQADLDSFHVYVADPTGKSFAQWWVYPVKSEATQGRIRYNYRRRRYVAPKTARYALCMRPDPTAVITYHPDYERATRAAMLRARKWLGSKWGLKSAARKLP